MGKKAPLRIHTSHFVSRSRADAYYEDYGFDAEAVGEKIQSGEIAIGPPKACFGTQRLSVNREGRYILELIDD